MTVIVMFPRETKADMRLAISLAVGTPLQRVYKDNDDLYFYSDIDNTDIHFKISQHISNIYRKVNGHSNFLILIKYFNDHVKVLSEDEYTKLYFKKA